MAHAQQVPGPVPQRDCGYTGHIVGIPAEPIQIGDSLRDHGERGFGSAHAQYSSVLDDCEWH